MPIDLDRGHGDPLFGPDGPPDFEARLRAATGIVLRYGRPRERESGLGIRYEPLTPARARSAVGREARVRLSAAPR